MSSRDAVIGGQKPVGGAPRALTVGEERAERLACALDRPVTVAGIVFILVVLADTATPPGSDLSMAWTIIIWVLWALFVLEFAARLVMARSTTRFLRRNWWQILFLLVPFLRFLRSFSRSARLARAGSSSVRSARTAAGRLGSRLAWLAALTVSIVLLGTNLLYELDVVESMPDALHTAALATIAGEPIIDAQGWGRAVEIALIMWSAIGFAALAGAAGAFFLEHRAGAHDGVSATGSATSQRAAAAVATGPNLSELLKEAEEPRRIRQYPSMPDAPDIIHLSLPVHDLDEARAFYVDVLGCQLGRVRDEWIDVWFFGMQLTLQCRPQEVRPVAEQGVRHFGVALANRREFDAFVARLLDHHVSWLTPPTIHPEGPLSGKTEVKLADPSSNVIEVKYYADPAEHRTAQPWE